MLQQKSRFRRLQLFMLSCGLLALPPLLRARDTPPVVMTPSAAVWKAPAEAAKKANPLVAPTPEALAAGKKVFTRQCMSCHGTQGKGDGPAAADQPVKPHDLTAPAVLKQTDGELFWKITTGRKPMLTFEKLLTEEQRWQVILYIRTLKKK